AGAALQPGHQILQGLENVGSGSGEQLRAGQVGFRGKVVAQGNAVDAVVAHVTDSGRAGGIEHVRGGLGGGAGENEIALVREVGQTHQLRQDALHFIGDGSAAGGV